MNTLRTLMIGTSAALLVGVGIGLGYWWAASTPGHFGAEAIGVNRPEGTGEAKKVLYWYDPMQPQQHFDNPGKSPFMDMPLTPKYADEGEQAGSVRIDASMIQNTGIRTAEVTKGRLAESVEGSGSLTYNDRDVAIVQARTGGIVERVYSHATNDVVEAGAPLADVRVPEWYGAQAEYLTLRRSTDPALVSAARDRLFQMGMSAALVGDLERSGNPQPLLTVRFGTQGVLQELGIREGMTVMPGQTLAKVNGLGTVWLEADIPEAQSGSVNVGAPVTASFVAWPDREYRGRVITLLPEVNRDARTVRVRAELSNGDGVLRPGMFARVRIVSPTSREALLVPSEAVISSGNRNVIILPAAEGRFRPIEVRVGRERDGKTEILSGMKLGERVVTSGQFLIDSEASLKGVLARMDAEAPAKRPEPVVVYEGQGTIRTLQGLEISIAHGAIPALRWGAMTMQFQLGDSELAAGIRPGDTVRFAFQHKGDDFIIDKLQKTEVRP